MSTKSWFSTGQPITLHAITGQMNIYLQYYFAVCDISSWLCLNHLQDFSKECCNLQIIINFLSTSELTAACRLDQGTDTIKLSSIL